MGLYTYPSKRLHLVAPNYATGTFLTYFPLLACSAAFQFRPRPPHCWGFQTQTPGRTPLSEWSSQCRGPLTTQDRTNRTSIPSAGFEPAISAVKRLQTYVLVSTATGLGL